MSVPIESSYATVLSQSTRLTDGQTEFSSLDRVCISCSAFLCRLALKEWPFFQGQTTQKRKCTRGLAMRILSVRPSVVADIAHHHKYMRKPLGKLVPLGTFIVVASIRRRPSPNRNAALLQTSATGCPSITFRCFVQINEDTIVGFSATGIGQSF